jgi:hypothetical protein
MRVEADHRPGAASTRRRLRRLCGLEGVQADITMMRTAVDDIHDTVARLRAHGAELVGEVAQYEDKEDKYRLCYMRGPAASSSRWPRNSSDAR